MGRYLLFNVPAWVVVLYQVNKTHVLSGILEIFEHRSMDNERIHAVDHKAVPPDSTVLLQNDVCIM